MNSNQLKLGSLLSYAQMLLGILIGLVYTPVMLRLLGQSEYGLYNTVASTIAMLSVLSLGFNSSYIRYYAQYKLRNDQRSIDKLNGLFMLIFILIGLVALSCGLYLSFNLDMVFADGLTPREYEIARVLMILLSVNLGLSFPMSVFTSIISAHEKYVVLKLLGIMKTVVGPLVSLPLLIAGKGSIAMVSVTLGISTLTDLIYFVYVKKGLKCRFVFHGFEKGLFKSLLIFTSFIALNLLVDQINTNIAKFLLGRYQGTEAVAIYAVGYSLYQYYMMFSTSVSGVFAPRVHRLVQSTALDKVRQRKELTELFTKIGRIQFTVLALIATGLIFFGKPFIHLWAGEGYELSYTVVLLLILPATIPLIQNIGIEIQRAQNNHHFRSVVYIIMALLNLFVSIYTCQRWGVLGAVCGTAISVLLANGLTMNIYYHKRCNVDILHFWKNILRLSLGMLPAIATGIAINHYMDLSNVLNMLLGIGIYTAVYCLGMLLLGFNKYEKDLLHKPLNLIKKKLKK